MSPSVNKQASLPSDLDSTHPHTHVLTAPSNARAVVTAPRAYSNASPHEVVLILACHTAWAQDEPPSPADQYDEINKLGPKVIAPTRPPDLASSSTSSFDRESDHRSRWWTFVRPRQGSIKRDRRVIDTTNRDQPQTDDRQSQYLVSLPERRSDESPVLRSTSPAPFAPAGSKTLRRDSSRRGRNETHDSQYAHMPERQDTESGEKSTLARSRKNRFTGFILTNIYVPLVRSWPSLIQLGPWHDTPVALQIHKHHIHDHCSGRGDPYETMGNGVSCDGSSRKLAVSEPLNLGIHPTHPSTVL